MHTIVWDRDDVLNDLMHCWLEQWWRPAHPECKVSYEDLSENPPHRILNIDLKAYLRSLDDFRLSKPATQMEPLPEVLSWFRKFGHMCRHVALTATPVDTAPAAAEWTFRHFGVWIRSFHFVPSIRNGQSIPQYDADKGAYLHWLGKGDIVVDDSTTNLQSVSQYGVSGVLIPRPWNGNRASIADALDHLSTKLGLQDSRWT